MLPLPSVVCLMWILHSCGKERSLRLCRYLHIVRSYGRETHASLSDYVISALVQVGIIEQAQQVFEKLLSPSEYSWNSLIVGLVKYGYASSAFELYKKMQAHECLHASGIAFVALLKACAQLADMKMGYLIHIEISRMGFLEKDVFVGSSLIFMYSKSGCIINALNVFDEVTVRNRVTWNALIAGCVENGYGDEALDYFEQMQEENLCPDSVTLVCCLKASTITGDTMKGRKIHIEIIKKGVDTECLVGNCLIDMYTKSGLLFEAQMLFDKLCARTMIAGTTLLAGYAEHGSGMAALHCFQQMQDEGIPMDPSTYVCILKACNSVKEIQKGFEIHAEISYKGFDDNPFIGTSLIDAYAKCGLFVEAHCVFEKLSIRDEIAWSSLISGLAENGLWEDVLNYVEKMQHELTSVSSTVAIVCYFKSCGMLKAIDRGLEMHNIIIQKGLIEIEFGIDCALIEMYSRCGLSQEARRAFHNVSVSCISSWTTFIAGLVDNGFNEEALAHFEGIKQNRMSITAVTYIWFLKACANMEMLMKAKELHAEIVKKGFPEQDIYVATALIDTYAKCRRIEDAQAIFDHIQLHNLVSWTALIGGYADCSRNEDAFKYFELMQRRGFSPALLTMSCCLKACSNARCIVNGQKIHAAVLRKGIESESIVHSLIDMYARCGWLAEAYYLFKKQPQRNSVAWLALISGYVELGHVDTALNLIDEMRHLDTFIDEDILIYVLKTFSSIGASSRGQEIHIQCVTRGLETAPLFGNSLVDMYGKCGLMAESQEVFDMLLARDVVSWTALIAGYAQIGKCEAVLHHLNEMVLNGMEPDSITFITIFNSCSHEGLVSSCEALFQSMSNYDLMPTIEHCICIVDLFGRAGQIEKGLVLIKNMPYDPGILLWHVVLGACRKWGNVELGRHAFHQATRLDEKNVAAYICMYNIYADAYMQ